MLTPQCGRVLPPFDRAKTLGTFHSGDWSRGESHMRRWYKLGASVAALSLVATGFASVAGASGDPTFPCVVVNADTCTVTIPLTSNMNEQVGSTMPDTKPWFFNQGAGQGPYAITGPG